MNIKYCCYLYTESATSAYLIIQNGIATLTSGPSFSINLNNNINRMYRLSMDIIGEDLTCALHDVDAGDALLSEVTDTDTDNSFPNAGGVAVIIPDSKSGHFFHTLRIDYPWTHYPTPAPSGTPSIPPTPEPSGEPTFPPSPAPTGTPQPYVTTTFEI